MSRGGNVIPTTAPQDAKTSALITHLRDSVIPAAERGNRPRVYVGGSTAIFDDFAALINSTVAHHHAMLKTAYNWILEEELFAANPALRVKNPPALRPKTHPCLEHGGDRKDGDPRSE